MAYQFSNREYTVMVQLSASCGGNASKARRMYAERYPDKRLPAHSTFLLATQRLLEYGSFHVPSHAQARGRDRLSARLEEDILEYFEDKPRASTRKAARRFNVHHKTIWNISNREQNAYHFQHVEDISEEDYAPRVQFCEWLLSNLHGNILWTDEALFTRFGLYKVHKEHENPPEKDSYLVWAGIVGDKVLGPYFIEGRLTGATYLQILQSVIEDMFDDLPVSLLSDLHFQHVGAPPQYERQVRDYLNNKFGDKWIGRGGPINWPPQSPDLTPIDFYLWGELYQLVYANRVSEINSASELKSRIIAAFKKVKDNHVILSRLRDNLHRRALLCVEQDGGRFEQLLKYTNIWNEEDSSCDHQSKMFCPDCNTELLHTAQGILEVYHYFEQEYEELKKMYEGLDLTPLSKFRQRTALATGVSETIIERILKEEEERNAVKQEEPLKPSKTKKRPRQADREECSDDNDASGEPSSNVPDDEPEVYLELAAVKTEQADDVNNAQAETDPISTDVKTEPRDDEEDCVQAQTDPISVEVKMEPLDNKEDRTNESLAPKEPTSTKRKGTKKVKTSNDSTSTRQHTQGECSTAHASRSAQTTDSVFQSSLPQREIKEEKIHILEEGFS